MKEKGPLFEALAALEHEQWMAWASNIMSTEDISPVRQRRWAEYMVPYDQLPEEVKEYDREWVRRVEDILYWYGIDTYV